MCSCAGWHGIGGIVRSRHKRSELRRRHLGPDGRLSRRHGHGESADVLQLDRAIHPHWLLRGARPMYPCPQLKCLNASDVDRTFKIVTLCLASHYGNTYTCDAVPPCTHVSGPLLNRLRWALRAAQTWTSKLFCSM